VLVDGVTEAARNAIDGALQQTEVGQRFEGAIDGGDPDRPPRLAEPVENVLRTKAAVLATEKSLT